MGICLGSMEKFNPLFKIFIIGFVKFKSDKKIIKLDDGLTIGKRVGSNFKEEFCVSGEEKLIFQSELSE